MKKIQNPTPMFTLNHLIFLGATLGVISGWKLPALYPLADAVSDITIGILRLISLPLIFLSVVATISGMENLDQMRRVGRRVISYTLLTTVIAACVALMVFLLINPAQPALATLADAAVDGPQQFEGYFTVLRKVIPTNIVSTFSENNVLGIMLIALSLSFAILTLPLENKKVLHSFFASLFQAFLAITRALVYVIPIGTWAFTTLFVKTVLAESTDVLTSLALYFFCIMGSNLIQAMVVLPLFLRVHRISPIATFKGMLPALTVAFFSRSSNTALPLTMECAEKNVGVSSEVATITLPLCSTINMNACAAFILTTVLFVAQSNGVSFSGLDMLVWIFISTIVAIGNAGVPMGCYFLTGALLATMHVPLAILGIILPLYAIIDMFETAINVWSDSCVAAMVNRGIKQ